MVRGFFCFQTNSQSFQGIYNCFCESTKKYMPVGVHFFRVENENGESGE